MKPGKKLRNKRREGGKGKDSLGKGTGGIAQEEGTYGIARTKGFTEGLAESLTEGLTQGFTEVDTKVESQSKSEGFAEGQCNAAQAGTLSAAGVRCGEEPQPGSVPHRVPRSGAVCQVRVRPWAAICIGEGCSGSRQEVGHR